jgi:hypothetical protein
MTFVLPWIDAVEVVQLDTAGKRSRLEQDSARAVASLLRRLSEIPVGERHAPNFELRFFSDGAVLATATLDVETGTFRGELGGSPIAHGFDAKDEQFRQLVTTLDQATETAARDKIERQSRAAWQERYEQELKDASEVAREGGEWRRTAACPNCRAETQQLLHGFDEEGLLWKGHICACEGWFCIGCREVLDRKNGCCR